jgi:TetR/AcrR family transcriptional repressor of mexJK operon
MKESSGAETRTEKKRAQIRDAAKRLFLRHGFQGTSTDAIVAAAGIASKETLYRYYAKKEALFVDVLRSLTTERFHIQQLMEQSTEPASVEELQMLLRAFTQVVLETMLQPEYLSLVRLTIAELPRFPELGTLFRLTVPDAALHYLQTLLSHGQTRGIVRPHKDLPTVARMLLGTLLTYAVLDGLWLMDQAPQMPEPGTLDAIVENIMDIVALKNNEEERMF